MDAFALLERVNEAGGRVAQICDNMPLDRLSDTTLDSLASRAVELDVTLEVGIRGSRPEHMRRNLEVARRLGARLLRVVLTGAGWEPTSVELVAVIKSLLADLRAAGTAMAIENHFKLTPTELARLVNAVGDPLVGVCLDPLNSITRLVGVAETVDTLAPLTLSVHAKDAVVKRQGTGLHVSGCPLGEGLVDIPRVLAAVSESGRSPNVLVECWMDRLQDGTATRIQEEDWVRRGVAYLRQLADVPTC